MYTPSAEFLDHIANSNTRTARSKIIVGNTTYTGFDVIKTAPSVSCDADFVGSFPAKTIRFELFNTGNLSLVGKEIKAYRGLDIDGTTEWIPLGVFIATEADIRTSQSGNYISYTGYDKAVLFDTPYKPPQLTYPITIGAYIQEIAFAHGVDVATTPFPCCDILLNAAPTFPEGTTEREVIRQIAELGGCNALIDRYGNLRIAYPVETNITINRKKYGSLASKEDQFGGVNAVIISNEVIVDNESTTQTYTYEDSAAIEAAGGNVVALTITNNAFAVADQQGFAEYIGDSYLFGLKYVPFELQNVVDDWLLDIGDIVTVEDTDGTTFQTVVLSYSNTDRIRSTVGANVLDDILTSYDIIGTVQKTQSYAGIRIEALSAQLDNKLSADGEFSGNLSGNVSFENLQAQAGGKIKIGDIEFTESGGTAKIGSTSPMQLGAFSDEIVNTLELYGTSITFRVDTSDYKAVMDSDGGKYTEICFRPAETDTGNIGTSDYVWDSGHFRNITAYNYVTAQNIKAVSNLTAETINAGSARVSGTMVIGSASDAQPSKGLKIVGIATATNTSAYASDKVMTIGSSGTLYQTGVTLSQLYAAAGSSSRKFKRDIAPLGSDFNIFDALQPVQFNYKCDNEKGLGLLAEDLAEIAPELCYYGESGEVMGVKYQSIIALLIREVQTLKERIKHADPIIS